MSAAEQSVSFSAVPNIIGFWNWDLRSDRIQLDPDVAECFSIGRWEERHDTDISEVLAAIHPQDRRRVKERVGECIRGGLPYSEVYRVVHAKLGTRWVRASGRCYLDESGTPTNFPGVVIEITDGESERSPHGRIAASLLEAREYSIAAEERLLTKLIEAVLIEAGRQLTRSLTGRVDGHA